MIAIEVKKELIKKVVTPFFRNNGFLKKGVKFSRDLSFFQIEADIQSQRYYKETGAEKFRINYHISCDRFTSLYGHREYFGGGSIQQENSWITIENNIELDELSNWLQKELKRILELIDKYSDIERIIDQLKKAGDVKYAFLLKEFNKDRELTEWRALRKNERAEYLSHVKEIAKEKQKLEKRDESLDKIIRLEGVEMRLRDLRYKVEEINNELQLLE